MSVLALNQVSKAYDSRVVLDSVNFALSERERVGLVGPNGEGKSTLLRLLAGAEAPDTGLRTSAVGLRIGFITQEPKLEPGLRARDAVRRGLGNREELLARIEQLHAALAAGAGDVDELGRLEDRLQQLGGHAVEHRVDEMMAHLGILEPDALCGTLSGGEARRVSLAAVLLSEPEVLLLDEPTNHLDIDAITWLEDFLLAYKSSLLFVTHDRSFLQRLATRIIELDRGRLSSWPGDFASYLSRKAEALETEARADALFDKRLANEEVWIRQGIEARRTRNEGRVRALEKMRNERQTRRERQGTAQLQLNTVERSGKLVAEAENLSFSYADQPIIKDFSTTILRGDKIGLIGPNGAGKTTLLRLLLGQLQPQHGSVRLGTQLQVAYFDQHRASLDEESSVMDNVAQGREQITINGKSKHIISYLQDFLFSPERARTPAKALSGGERNRLLLARLFTQPANVLVMDEPTNDLDMETLELLETLLMDYNGTLLLVSHDRSFLDNVVTSTLVFDGKGNVQEYVGGYEDWLRQRPKQQQVATKPATTKQDKTKQDKPGSKAKPSYKEQRELESLPQQIEALEKEQKTLHQAMAAADFYQQDKATIASAQERLAVLEAELGATYARWEKLEAQLEAQ